MVKPSFARFVAPVVFGLFVVAGGARADDGSLTLTGASLNFSLQSGSTGTLVIDGSSIANGTVLQLAAGAYTFGGGSSVVGVAGTFTLLDLSPSSTITFSNVSGTSGATLTLNSTFNPGGSAAYLTVSAVGSTTTSIIGATTVTVGGASDTQATSLLLSGASMTFDLASTTSHDQVDVGTLGSVSFSNTVLTLNEVGTTLGTGTYTLFTAGTAGSYSGLVVDGNGAISGGLTLSSSTLNGMNTALSLSGGDIVLTLSAAPEPSSLALSLLGLGAAAFTLTLRRRRPVPAATSGPAGSWPVGDGPASGSSRPS
ncbi:PEP-CTERM protein-sorting domain-containing protein [Verrucomicrobium sp. GAS474]|uniref:PEP-CTERM sorting domain-containing protein n=1 Tax=Verrucomicrobium sp. GAS474 TaxID=1882831 RepID=UPI00087A2A2F|nr:PEP-CTERM sorting domain-containing protein [Verrucomicrobium sp. GAS474]SDU00588.1 PEP-CTERM protein-sorting domain-containing protein [Verrucomicrobium sp. GAS474]